MTAQVSCGTTDARCADLEWAADNPTICPGTPAISGFRIAPESGQVEVAGKYQFRAYLVFEDGEEQDVTEKARWTSNNTALATIDDAGLATGIAVGTATVEGSYRNYFDISSLTVIAACVQAPMDIVLVIDRSGTMSQKSFSDETRLESVQKAAKAMTENCAFPKDKVAVVSFGGIREEATDGTITVQSDATLHTVFSTVKEDVNAAIDAIAVPDQCIYTPPAGGQGNRCASGIGGGLQVAINELTGSRARANTRKVVVLFTDGVDNICDPDPVTVDTALKAANCVIVVIAANVPDVSETICGSATFTHAWLESLATCNFFFTGNNADDYIDIFARIPSEICAKQNNVCMYTLPATDPPETSSFRDQLDYTGWKNWVVTSGFVDLIGIDLYPLLPGNGHYMDLVGTDQSRPDTSKNAVGAIETKQAFTFSAGRYRLTVQLAGNQRQPERTDKVRIQVSSPLAELLNKMVTVIDWQQGFRDYPYDFSVAGAASASIKIAHQPLERGSLPTAGLLLGRVKLENLDTGAVMFDDDFDDENP